MANAGKMSKIFNTDLRENIRDNTGGPLGTEGDSASLDSYIIRIPIDTPGTTGIADATDLAGDICRPISCINFPLPSTIEELKKFEGTVDHLYRDSNGFITIGIGHNLEGGGKVQEPPDEFLKLKLKVRETNQLAKRHEKEEAWKNIKKAEVGYIAGRYKTKTKLYLPKEECQKLLEADIEETVKQLKSLFAEFDRFPVPAREALLDMAFNMGVNKIRTVFTEFTNSIRKHDWLTAARESKRKEEKDGKKIGNIPSRNRWVRTRFEAAFLQDEMYRYAQTTSSRYVDSAYNVNVSKSTFKVSY